MKIQEIFMSPKTREIYDTLPNWKKNLSLISSFLIALGIFLFLGSIFIWPSREEKMAQKDAYYAAQDVGEDLQKLQQEGHEIEVERHPEGYGNQ